MDISFLFIGFFRIWKGMLRNLYVFCFLHTPFTFMCIEEPEKTENCVRLLILLACIFSFLLIKSIIGYVHAIKDENAITLMDKINLLFNEPIFFELIVCCGLVILVLGSIMYFLSRFFDFLMLA